jgi:hypothetical protein
VENLLDCLGQPLLAKTARDLISQLKTLLGRWQQKGASEGFLSKQLVLLSSAAEPGCRIGSTVTMARCATPAEFDRAYTGNVEVLESAHSSNNVFALISKMAAFLANNQQHRIKTLRFDPKLCCLWLAGPNSSLPFLILLKSLLRQLQPLP